ncbi:uncharacterized protein VNE69_02296 [Vairimorpha necatrix]|uniref:Uncharacterized protein n=1 Tax=Vairimorpha necatrix TaxID=6039 RepID=A0AAX4JA57_9MICR
MNCLCFLFQLKCSLFQESIDDFDLSLFEDGMCEVEKNNQQSSSSNVFVKPQLFFAETKSNLYNINSFSNLYHDINDYNKGINKNIKNEKSSDELYVEYRTSVNILDDFENQYINIVPIRNPHSIICPSLLKCNIYAKYVGPLNHMFIHLDNLKRNIALILNRFIKKGENNDVFLWLDLLQKIFIFLNRFDNIDKDSYKNPVESLLIVNRNKKVLELLEIVNIQCVINKIILMNNNDTNELITKSIYSIKCKIGNIYFNLNLCKERLNLIYIILTKQLVYEIVIND